MAKRPRFRGLKGLFLKVGLGWVGISDGVFWIGWFCLDGSGWGDDYFGGWWAVVRGGGGRGVLVVVGLVGEEREGREMIKGGGDGRKGG